MALSLEEKVELDRLLWAERYYCDAWLANMAVLDSLRPLVEKLRDQQVELVSLLKRGEVSSDEGMRIQLTIMREWWQAYQERLPVVDRGRAN